MNESNFSDEAVRDAAERFRKAIEETDETRLPIALQEFPLGSAGDATPLLGTFLIESGLGKFDYVSGQRGGDRKHRWTTHAWLQQGPLIVDITADQYRDCDEPVIVSRNSVWHEQFNGEKEHIADYRIYDDYTERTLGKAYRTIVGRVTSLRRHGPRR